MSKPSNKICPRCGKGGYYFAFGELDLYEEKKPVTNADRIRQMADEELARLFADDNCGYCHIHDFCFAKGCQIDCENMWIDWLKSPVNLEAGK